MKIKDYKSNFIASLIDQYPAEEINSFFNRLTESYLGMSRLELALDQDRDFNEGEEQRFEEALERLKKFEPLQYILGETEFFGLNFKVQEGVLIPRPETEELVAWIMEEFKNADGNIRILDIGTGSGCIAISLAKNLPNSEVTAIDFSKIALEVAKENAALNEVDLKLIEANILNAERLPEKYDIIISNPPYVRELEKAEMQPNVLNFEPDSALYVEDQDPLIFYSKITKLAKANLGNAGTLYFEINQYLGSETEQLLKNHGFQTELRKDMFGNYRMLKGWLQ